MRHDRDKKKQNLVWNGAVLAEMAGACGQDKGRDLVDLGCVFDLGMGLADCFHGATCTSEVGVKKPSPTRATTTFSLEIKIDALDF